MLEEFAKYGESKSPSTYKRKVASGNKNAYGKGIGDKAGVDSVNFGDSGSAARFFYCAKASKKERGEGNDHPTVKPLALMEYLCKLVTPPNGLILDPFMGSGTTGKAAVSLGFRFIGCELHEHYFEIASGRV